jgi:hypothetical protein
MLSEEEKDATPCIASNYYLNSCIACMTWGACRRNSCLGLP